MTPSARILGTSKATAQPRRSGNPRPSDGRTGDAYNTSAFSARFGTSNTRLGLSGRAEFLLAHVKIFYTFQKRVKNLAIFLHVKSAAPDPAVKETLRYREALFADVENACNVTRPTATKRLEELVAAGVLDDRRAGRDRLFVNVPLMEILRNPKAATSAR